MTLETSIRCLKVAGVATTLFGLAMVLALVTPLKPLFDLFLDLIHLPLDGHQSLSGDSTSVLMAISGGLMCGLGVLVWHIAKDVYSQDPKGGGRIILYGVYAWYFPDSLGSVLAGAWFNVVLNTGFLALFVVPIYLARPKAATATAH